MLKEKEAEIEALKSTPNKKIAELEDLNTFLNHEVAEFSEEIQTLKLKIGNHCFQIHIFQKNSHVQNLIFHKIHNFKVTLFTKFTFFKRQILGNFWIKS